MANARRPVSRAGSVGGWATLVEREREREAIGSALDGAAGRHGRFVIVYGPSGIGRSSLVEAALLDARTRGLAVLEARGSELERGYGFGVVRQLLEARVAGSSAREQRTLLGSSGPAAESALGIGGLDVRAESSGFDQIEALHRLVGRLADDTPLLLAVDDLQWCDRPSLDFLCFVGHRTTQLPVTVVAAWRRGEPGVKAGRLQALAGMPQTFFLTPAPLSRAGVRAVLARETGTEPSEEAVDAAHEQTGGQPLLVAELAAGLRLRGVPLTAGCRAAIEAVVPESVRRHVVARLDRHPETVQRVARAVAVLGEDSVTNTADLAGTDRERACQAIGALVRAGLLLDDARVSYAAPMLRRAVYDTLSSLERSELHQQAADLLCSLSQAHAADEVERAARHLVSCQPVGDPRFAAVLCEAARRSAAAGADGDARRFYERALGEVDEPSARAAVLTRLAEIELRLDDLAAAESHGAEALDLAATPTDRADAALALAPVLAAGPDWREAVELLEAEAHALDAGDPELKRAVLAVAGLIRGCAGAAAPEPGSEAACDELAGTTPAERAVLAARASEAALTGARSAEHVAELSSRALGGGGVADAFAVAATDYLACRAAVLADADTLADGALARWASDADAVASGDRRVAHLALRAQLSLARGNLGEAGTAAADALAGLEAFPPSALRRRIRGDVLAVLALVGLERGQLEEAERALAGLSDAESTAGPAFACLEIAVSLARSEPAAELAGAVSPEPRGLVAPATCPALWAALACHAAGDRERAVAIADDRLELARTWGGASFLGRALVVRSVVGARAERVAFAEQAVAALERSPARLELARAAVELGAALRRSGRRREARQWLTRGGDLAHRCGADALVARARAELVATGARPRRAAFTGVSSLTPAERRVALLAAAGMTTREIAKELTVSVKTISGQLSSVYGKLDVHDRAALAVAMREVESGPAERERAHVR